MSSWIEVDGSQGEGGGQVLRTSLALSVLTGKPTRIEKIRMRRSRPGLRPQHLQAVKAAAAISQAQVEGAVEDSQFITFAPSPARSGRYRFEIGTAGSTSLVLQTIALPLSLAKGTSQVTITGGTHVPFSPAYHFLEAHWLAFMQQIGLRIDLSLEAAGFYPQGGGQIRAAIRPAKALAPLQQVERGALVRIRGLSGTANLDDDIARRQKHQALRRLEAVHRDSKIQTIQLPSPGKGTFLCLTAAFEHTQACFCALGAPGKRAERVADEAVAALESFLQSGAALDQHLADQLLLPLCFASGESQFTTARIDGHLLTQAAVIGQFIDRRIEIRGERDAPGTVVVRAG